VHKCKGKHKKCRKITYNKEGFELWPFENYCWFSIF